MQQHKKTIHQLEDLNIRCWNKGLTKETSEKIKNASIKISKALKGKSIGRANTIEGENIRRAKISLAISKRNELI